MAPHPVVRGWVGAVGVGLLVSACGVAPAENGSPTLVSPTQVSDSGFDVATNGFSFQNYGNEDGVANLNAATMRQLFGDVVCGRSDDGRCVLAATARQWMEAVNDSMNGGHCFGMAGLSWAMFTDAVDPEQYGAAAAAELDLAGSPELQREVARFHATQFTSPTVDHEVLVSGADLIDTLESAWGEGKGYVLALFRMQDGDQVDGHAITPIAIRDGDGSKPALLVYDSNFPGEPQQITVDEQAGSWTYRTAADPLEEPEVYQGGRNNQIELYPVDLVEGAQVCPFCRGGSGPDADPGNVGRTVSKYNAVFLSQLAGHRGVSLAVTDPDGRPIPGQETLSPATMTPTTAPDVELVPRYEPFLITVDSRKLRAPTDTDVSIIGPGYSYAVDRLDMVPGRVDEVFFDPGKNQLSYATRQGATPDITLTLETPEASFEFVLAGLQLPHEGGAVRVVLDPVEETIRFNAPVSRRATVDFAMTKITEDSQEELTSDPIPLRIGETIVIPYGQWVVGEPLPVGIDTDGDGQSDEPLVTP